LPLFSSLIVGLGDCDVCQFQQTGELLCSEYNKNTLGATLLGIDNSTITVGFPGGLEKDVRLG